MRLCWCTCGWGCGGDGVVVVGGDVVLVSGGGGSGGEGVEIRNKSRL